MTKSSNTYPLTPAQKAAWIAKYGKRAKKPKSKPKIVAAAAAGKKSKSKPKAKAKPKTAAAASPAAAWKTVLASLVKTKKEVKGDKFLDMLREAGVVVA
jgi:hypothetical protein